MNRSLVRILFSPRLSRPGWADSTDRRSPRFILGGDGTGHKGHRLLRDADNLLEEVADNWGSPDASGVWFLFCDGHVRLFAYDTPRKLVAAVISPGGGETVDLDD